MKLCGRTAWSWKGQKIFIFQLSQNTLPVLGIFDCLLHRLSSRYIQHAIWLGLHSTSPCYRLVWKYSRKPLCCPPRLVEECSCECTWKAARSRVQTSLLNLPSLLLLLIHCHVTSHSELQITSSANSPPWRAIELLCIILLKFQWKQKLGITQGM